MSKFWESIAKDSKLSWKQVHTAKTDEISKKLIFMSLNAQKIKKYPRSGKDWGLEKTKGVAETAAFMTHNIKWICACISFYDYCKNKKDRNLLISFLNSI